MAERLISWQNRSEQVPGVSHEAIRYVCSQWAAVAQVLVQDTEPQVAPNGWLAPCMTALQSLVCMFENWWMWNSVTRFVEPLSFFFFLKCYINADHLSADHEVFPSLNIILWLAGCHLPVPKHYQKKWVKIFFFFHPKRKTTLYVKTCSNLISSTGKLCKLIYYVLI